MPKPRWRPLPELLYAQVVKSYRRRRLVGVTHRVVFGTRLAIEPVLAACGWTINTAFIERLNLDIRQRVAAVGRRVNTLCRGEEGLLDQLVLFQTYHNFVLLHASLRQPLPVAEAPKGSSAKVWRPCTPTMAAGLTDHVIDKESCFQLPYSLSKDRDFPVYIGDGSHLGGSARGEQDMHGRITNPDHGALDAYPHIFESACALRCSTNTQGLPSHRLPITPSPNASWHVPGQYSHHRLEGT